MRLMLAAILAMGAVPALAAGPTQDWPCVQVLQPRLSVGSMWSGPEPDAQSGDLARSDHDIMRTADRLAQRRTDMAAAGTIIDSFAEHAGPAQLTALFEAVFRRIDAERSALLSGISRYGHGQGMLADRIEQRREKMAGMEQADPPDFDAIDAEEVALDWDMRIFEERRLMLSAVCDTPVLLEQRLYELAKMIQAKLPDQEG